MGVSPFVKSQAESIQALGHSVEIFPIRGKGVLGYLSNILPLSRKIKHSKYHLVHAHYSLSGVLAWLASKPFNTFGFSKTPHVVVSLLGSDVNGRRIRRLYIRLLSFMWAGIIVKSQEMKTKLGLEKVDLIPNGVDLERFKELDRAICREDLGLKHDKTYILFAADPKRQVKNYPLAFAAYKELLARNRDLSTDNCVLLTLGFTGHDLVPKYLNACDVLLSTSLWEGSPNIIKEAMACNCPIVSTQVGDVEWLFGDLGGCFLAEADTTEVAQKLHKALVYQTRTAGRDRIIELGLDSHTVAEKLVHLYQRIGQDRET